MGHLNEDDKAEALILTMSMDAMQLDSRSSIDLPADIIDLIASKCSDLDGRGCGRGGMNALRLVSKRLMRVVESCATRLSILDYKWWDGPRHLPVFLGGYKRIEHIKLDSYKLESLEGCPDGLKSLHTTDSYSLQSLEPLRRCTELERLNINFNSKINNLDPLSELVNLKRLYCHGINPQTSVLPLASCKGLRELRCDPKAADLNELQKKKPDLIVIHRW